MRTWLTLLAVVFACHAGAEPQLIVRLQPGANALQIARKFGVKLRSTTANAPFALYGVPRYLSLTYIQFLFNSDPGVVWAEENVQVADPEGQSAIKGSTIPAVGDRSALYAANTNVLAQINWSSTLANSAGRTVTVAVLDTGLAQSQTYLWDKVDASENFVEPGWPAFDRPLGYDTNGNGTPDEGVGHGSMVTGIVDQVAPLTRLVVARIADSDGIATAWTIVEGLAFAATHGAEVANMSLGSPYQIAALTDVMDWCEERHLLVVAGIGNANRSTAFYPARVSKVVCVAGLYPDSTKAAFSNWDGSTRSSAPATGIVSQWWDGHMGTWSGTSFSSPMVAGAIADCLRRTGTLSLSTIRTAIKNSGDNIDALNPFYQGKLGTRLDIQQLNAYLQG